MNTEYVLYCRKSTDESSGQQNQSIPDQIEKCIEYANKHWFKIMKKPKDFSMFESEKEILRRENHKDKHSRSIYNETKDLFIIKESHSAKRPLQRPKWNKLIQFIQQWKIKGLISYSPDRQARNLVDWWTIVELADTGMVDLKYATLHYESNNSGNMTLWILFVFSKQFSDKLSEDISRWNENPYETISIDIIETKKTDIINHIKSISHWWNKHIKWKFTKGKLI